MTGQTIRFDFDSVDLIQSSIFQLAVHVNFTSAFNVNIQELTNMEQRPKLCSLAAINI